MMRALKLVVPACVAVLLAAGQTPSASGKTDAGREREIKSLQAQLKQAFLKSDTAFLEKRLADDYTAVYSSGALLTKAQVIDGFRSGAIRYESISERDETIRIYGDTAVVIWLFSAKAIIGGKPFSGDVRGTRVWIKLNGDWKLVAFHSTLVRASQ